MKTKNFFPLFNLVIFVFFLIYGVFSGGLSSAREREVQGKRLLIALYDKYSGKVSVKKNYKYFDITLELKGEIFDYKIFLNGLGYKEIAPLHFCKLGNEVFFRASTPLIMEYKYDSKDCIDFD